MSPASLTEFQNFLAALPATAWVEALFVLWVIAMAIRTIAHRSIDGLPLDKRMPIVDIPVEFMARLIKKKADGKPHSDDGKA